MIEACFKAFARALREAVSIDPDESGVPSTKGTLTDAMTRIAILDYGMGNLRSVEKALEHVGAEASDHADAGAAAEADGLVLPGVGAFPKAMERLRELGLDGLIARAGRGRDAAARHLPRACSSSSSRSTELGGARASACSPATVERARGAGPQGPAHGLGAGALGARVAR